MIKNRFFLSSFLIITQAVFSQFILKGKIVSDSESLGELYITNTTNNSKAIADKAGLFTITVQLNHVLVITGEKIDARKIYVKQTDLTNEYFIINVYPKTKKLTEVVIYTNQKLNSASLGIIDKHIKSYTPAERKIKTAGKFKWYSPLLIPFGGMSVDGLLNKISGRTSMLKKELVVENLEKNQLKLTNLFQESFYTETLGIPKENLNGFIIYACETSEISNFLKENNSIKVRYALIDLSVKYKEIIFVK